MNDATQREEADTAAMRQHALSLPDHCTRAGAEALAQRLDAYWHVRGHAHVRHWVVPLAWDDRTLSDVEAAKITAFGVRSNLFGGMPPKGT